MAGTVVTTEYATQPAAATERIPTSTTSKRRGFPTLTDSAREIVIAAALLVAAIVIGLWSGELGWSLLIATGLWLAMQAREFRKVYRWAQHPWKRPENGSDIWFALAYRPFRALMRERQRTRAMAARMREILNLAEVMPDAVVVLNSLGNIEGLNSAAKELLYLSDADIGLGLTTVVRNPDFIHYIRSGRTDEPLEFTSSVDTDRTYEARRIETDIGHTIMLVRDITTLNRVLTMRQNFVANVSHELRTPLTVVAGYLETMADPEQPEELRLALTERLSTPVRRMQTLVDDLMLLTQLEVTPAEGHMHPVKLGQLIQSAVMELAPLCTTPNQIQVCIESDATVLGIESELHSVCANLLSNAIRYSPEGGPILVSLSDHGEFVRLLVKDSGYGIAPEHLNRLTERFYRVDMAGARSRGGTGLGLAIVKHVLRRHDSELQVESTLGEGSTFFCDFKRATATRSTQEKAEEN